MTIYVLDVETRLLASEVEEQYAETLAGESAWNRPDLFGFACGVLLDADSGEAMRYGPEEASEMIERLSEADVTVGYNSAAFDLNVLSAYGDVSALRERHVDLCSAMFTALNELAAAEGSKKRLRHGGLDGLAKANGLAGKTGAGAGAPALYRDGHIEELLSYCEADVRLTATLYSIAREHGSLTVEPYHHDRERNRVELGPRELPVSLAPAPR